MQANSPANSTPASSPAPSEPSRVNSATPRQRHQAHSSSVAPAKRTAAWNTGGTSASVAFTSTCWKPQNRQQASSSEVAVASRWSLRAVMPTMVEPVAPGDGQCGDN